MRKPKKYVWLIAHIDSSKIDRLEKDINRYPEYRKNLEAHVPMVTILKKTFKGKDFFNDVPLLFNYGFFRVPTVWALNPDILEIIKANINCIFSWVKDPAGGRHNNIPYASCSKKEVKRLMELANEESVHSSEDIENLKPGDLINLIGYPFQGMAATVLTVDKKGKQVIVEIESIGISREVKVSFDNVFYSIYRGSYSEKYNQEKTLLDHQLKNHRDEETE